MELLVIYSYVGATIAIVAAVFSNMGTNICKASHLRNQELPLDSQVAYYYRPAWWFGFVCTMFASVADFVALGLAAQSLVAALGGATSLICNVFVGTTYNKEQVETTDIVGVLMIILGAVFFACFSESKPRGLDWETQFWNTWFVPYLACQLLITAALISTISTSCLATWRRSWYRSITYPLEQAIRRQQARIEVLEAKVQRFGSIDERDVLGFTMEDLERQLKRDQTRHSDQYIYAASAGAVGALSVLFGGITSSMLDQGVEQAFSSPFFYMMLGSMIITLVGQTDLQNRGLELGDIVRVYPVFEGFWITFGVISGKVFYHTDQDTWGDEMKQGPGLIAMVAGAYLLCLRKDSEKEGEALRISESTVEMTEASKSRLRSGSIMSPKNRPHIDHDSLRGERTPLMVSSNAHPHHWDHATSSAYGSIVAGDSITA